MSERLQSALETRGTLVLFSDLYQPARGCLFCGVANETGKPLYMCRGCRKTPIGEIFWLEGAKWRQ